jgi:hypothetical protein
MSFEGDCHEVEVTPNLELLLIFGYELGGSLDMSFIRSFNTKSKLIWRKLAVTKNSL